MAWPLPTMVGARFPELTQPERITMAKSKKNASGKAKTTTSKAKKTTKVKKSTKRKAAKRELINTGTDKRYVRRNVKGQFKESDDVGRSLSMDRRRKSKRPRRRGREIKEIGDGSG